MGYSEGLSPSDVALLSGNGGNNSGNGFGEGSGWWIIVFLIFALGGWGNRGGFGGGSGSGASDNYVLASDFATLQRQMSDGFNGTNRKADAIQEGICDATFALNNTINNGFFGVQNALCQGFAGVNQAVVNQGYENRLGTQALSSQLANCCCDIRQEIADCCCKTQTGLKDISYNIAMSNNSLQNAMCLNTRDIIENMNNNYRAIHEELVANKLEMKNDRIAEQQNEINALRLKASQEAQNNYLISQLGEKCAVPAYVVNGPTPVNFPTNCCNTFSGFNNNCGCGGY